MSTTNTLSPAGRSRRPALSWWATLVALGLNIGIHAALTPMHLDEKFYIGVLFCVGNAALFLALLLLVSQTAGGWGWVLAVATSLVELGGFVVSRTIGLPGGYHETWTTHTEDLLGLVCMVCEAVVVVAAANALRHRRPFGVHHIYRARDREALRAA